MEIQKLAKLVLQIVVNAPMLPNVLNVLQDMQSKVTDLAKLVEPTVLIVMPQIQTNVLNVS